MSVESFDNSRINQLGPHSHGFAKAILADALQGEWVEGEDPVGATNSTVPITPEFKFSDVPADRLMAANA